MLSTPRNSHSLKTLVFLHIGDWYGAVVLLGKMVGKLTHSNALFLYNSVGPDLSLLNSDYPDSTPFSVVELGIHLDVVDHPT